MKKNHFVLLLLLSLIIISQLTWWVIFQVQASDRISDLVMNNAANLETTKQKLDILAEKGARMFVFEASFFTILILSVLWFLYWELDKRMSISCKTDHVLDSTLRDLNEILVIVKDDKIAKKISNIRDSISLVQTLSGSKGKLKLEMIDISKLTKDIVKECEKNGQILSAEIEDGLTGVTNPHYWSKFVKTIFSKLGGKIDVKFIKDGDVGLLRINSLPPVDINDLEALLELVASIGCKKPALAIVDSKIDLRVEIPIIMEKL